MSFSDKINFHLQDRTEKQIAEQLDITEDQARAAIKDASFSEYLKLREANTDKSAFYQQTTTTSSDTDMDDSDDNAAATAQSTYVKPDGKIDHTQTKVGNSGTVTGIADDDLDVEITRKMGREYEVKTKDGQTFKVDQDMFGAPKSFLSDLGSAMKRGATKGTSYAARQKVQVNNSAEQEEIRRIQELAGIDIEEMASGGATAAGAIAAAPSVIGNTAHKPTDRLRAKNRRKREKKKK